MQRMRLFEPGATKDAGDARAAFKALTLPTAAREGFLGADAERGLLVHRRGTRWLFVTDRPSDGQGDATPWRLFVDTRQGVGMVTGPSIVAALSTPTRQMPYGPPAWP